MYRRNWFRLAVFLALGFAALQSSAEILKIVIDDTINPIVAEHIQRAIQDAQRTRADAVLIDIRTPGGLVSSTRDIVHDILTSPVPVIIYVTPTGSTSASAGFFILESADVAAMAPGTNTGAAHPVLMGTTMDPVMKEKVENDAAAFMRSFAAKRGHDNDIAESVVRQSKSFTAEEALSKHLIDYVAADEKTLMDNLEGKTITRFDGSKTVLHVAGKPIRLFGMTLKEEILGWLMDPNIALFLLAIGIFGIFLEFNHPGVVVPGVVGFLSVLLAVFALQLLPVRYAALGMILGAFILFALEAKFQTHGVLGIGGIVSMMLGALLLVDGPIPQMRVQWWAALSISLPLGAITIFLMTIALKARRNKITTGEEGMVGEIGVVRSPLTPSGKVFLDGALWDAVANTAIETGSSVIVRRVENLVLHVEPALHIEPAPPANSLSNS
ncbi:MAG TPA: nodulation protein NfeD [Candidatus Angelobacter sp.]|nr:nodulation protein NfeD [Candidatus Angelobacter sp.]